MLKMIKQSNPGIFYSGEIGGIFRDYFLFASSLYSTPQKESSKEKFNRSIEKRVLLFIYKENAENLCMQVPVCSLSKG